MIHPQASVNGYLMRLSRAAIVREEEKEKITRSVNRIRFLLKRHFKHEVQQVILFGSYSRHTILPRRMDQNSDVDIMILFGDDGYRPQTYLNRLRRFVEATYGRSESRQSHPTIQLGLNHITFELVPAVKGLWGAYQIPVRDEPWDSWMGTDPNGFNRRLSEANQDHQNLVKPLVRVMKYWNATAGYPFQSYGLEQEVVSAIHDNFYIFGKPKSIGGYFYDFVENHLNDMVPLFAAAWRRDAVERLQNVVEDVRQAERRLRMPEAIGQLQRVIPPASPIPVGR